MARGNLDRGRELFANPKILACGRCHAIGGKGGDIGRDLSIVGAIYGCAYLIEAILHPSRIVQGGYRQAIVQTNDGGIRIGLVNRDSADELILQEGEGNRKTIRKDAVAGRKMSETSIMPEGLAAGLRLDEFSDLIASLETVKQE